MIKNALKIFRKNKLKKRKRSSSFLQFKKFLIADVRKTFETLKTCFVTELLLHHFDLKCKLRMKIDASNKTINDVLCQQALDSDD